MPTAWELIGFDDDGLLRIKGGRALYETAIFYDGTRQRQVKLARVDVGPHGLRQVNRYVDPDTEIEIVPQHARILVATKRLAGGGRSAHAKCRCGWVAVWPRTQAEAADAYRAHKRQVR